MQEDWDVCVAHMELIGQTIGEVIAQGVASGEFEVEDLEVAALCACTAMMRFFHPQMIAQCAEKAGPDHRPDDRFRHRRPVAARRALIELSRADVFVWLTSLSFRGDA